MTHNRESVGPAIEIVSLAKRYGETNALSDVTLDIQHGEFLVLLGPSGCGKSTLLKIVAGLEEATDGEVYIQGRLANYVAPKARDVSMVFQNYALYPHMTIAKNIGFPLKMRGEDKTTTRERVLDAARLLELEDHLEKYPEQLSGGQRQRVALGRALVRDPAAFLMDEPLSNLDALLRVQMREELLKLHRRVGRTTIYVTHDQVEAMTMADRIVVLKSGLVQQVGTAEEIYSRPVNTFVATFVGSPQMNLFPGRMTDGHFVGRSVQLSLNGLAPSRDGDATVGVRAEDIALLPADAPTDVAGTVELVEPVGADKYLSVRLVEGERCVVRTRASARHSEGEIVHLDLHHGDLHVFDERGERMS